MKNILTIAKWEINRLRTQFGGKSKFIILPVIVLMIFSAFLIYHQDFTTCKGIYTIGVTPNGPAVTDKRFNVLIVDGNAGQTLLRQGTIDLYLTGNAVKMRRDSRSQYAAGALQKYLEKQELVRIASQYETSRAFPLRVQINYLKTEENHPQEEFSAFDNAGNEPSTGMIADIDTRFNDPTSVSKTEPATNAGPDTGSADSVSNAKNPVNNSNSESGRRQDETHYTDSPALSSRDPLPDMINPLSQGTFSDSEVRQQLEKLEAGGKIPEFKAEFASDNEIIVPSLMNPPMPLAQVIIAFFYIIPIFFVSVFFTSSFTEEKVNRRLIILLSAPVSRLQVILGKMLPYYAYSILVIMAVTLILHGNTGMALAIFVPVMLFIFAIYLMVALTYRTFKDQTFFSVLALSVITVYLVVPAMFTGVSNLSYISPLTLAVIMFRGESFGIGEYLIATLPLYITFFLVMYVSVRVFNEEYLMGYKPLHIKALDALFAAIDKRHLYISIFLFGLLAIPLVLTIQLVSVVLAANLPSTAILWPVLCVAVVIEEIAKSAGIAALIKYRIVSKPWDLFKLAFLSSLGFWVGEKALLVLTLKVIADSKIMTAVLGIGSGSGWQLIIPLIVHIACTYLVCLILAHRGWKSYPLALISGAVVHAAYNISILLTTGALK